MYKLKSGTKANRKSPESFWVPTEAEKDAINPGDYVKLMFKDSSGTERMWVLVVETGDEMKGTLANGPVFVDSVEFGEVVTFKRKHVIDILKEAA